MGPAGPTRRPRCGGVVRRSGPAQPVHDGSADAGVGHLTFVREEFQAQVPDWVPVDDDTVVWLSGAAEIILGAALLSGRHKKFWGRSAAAFFAAIFPGNVGQLVEHKDGFGLDDDRKRAIRLLFQPILVGLALEGTRED